MFSLDVSDTEIFFLILGISFILIIILFILCISNRKKYNKLNKKYEKFINGNNDINLEKLLDDYISKVNEVACKNKEIELHLNLIDRNIINCIQKFSMIRFNAFDDVGSDLSYTAAFLDGNDSGIVITSLFSRDFSTTYGKPVSGGKSKYPLSAEEIKVINDAIRKKRESQYV